MKLKVIETAGDISVAVDVDTGKVYRLEKLREVDLPQAGGIISEARRQANGR